jgi:hypothetical protein
MFEHWPGRYVRKREQNTAATCGANGCPAGNSMKRRLLGPRSLSKVYRSVFGLESLRENCAYEPISRQGSENEVPTPKLFLSGGRGKTGSGRSRAVIPLKPKGLTPISCHAVLERSACAPFIKERHMERINATRLRRKSGQWGTRHWLPVWRDRPNIVIDAVLRLISKIHEQKSVVK